MRSLVAISTTSLIVLAAATYLMSREFGSHNGSQPEAIRVFCAASNRAVMDQIVRDYYLETGRSVVVQYGASQTLLGAIEITGVGDLYLPADSAYAELAQAKGLCSTSVCVARQTPVLVVARANNESLRIDSLEELIASDARLVQADPSVAAIGRATKRALSGSGLWQALNARTTAYRTMVTDVANDVLIGAADAGIVYDSLLHSYPKLKQIRVPELERATSQVHVCQLNSSGNVDLARDFADFIASETGGMRRYAEYGFRPPAR